MAVTPADSRLQKLLRKQHSFATRQMNFINLKKRNPKYRYRKQVLQGFNEHWFTQPMCSKCSRAGVKMEFRNPSTGSRIPGSSKGSDMVKLGSMDYIGFLMYFQTVEHSGNREERLFLHRPDGSYPSCRRRTLRNSSIHQAGIQA